MFMRQPCSGVILAGGLATRCGGENKALLPLGGVPLIDRLLDVYRQVFEDVIVVTNDPLAFVDRDAKIVTDIFTERSSLTGIHAGLFYAEHPFAFVSACDTPFLARGIVEAVLDRVRPEIDIVMPLTAAGAEPLCAAYSRRCLRQMENSIVHGRMKIRLALSGFRLEHVPEADLRAVDPELASFFNVNTLEDLSRAEQMLAAAHTSGYPFNSKVNPT
jgi:molybdopterin-guanine dinucleotide biosynthesis protein A